RGVRGGGRLRVGAERRGIERVNLCSQTDVVFDTRVLGARHTLLGGVELGRQAQDEIRHQAASITGVTLSSSVRDADFASAPVTVDRKATGTVAAGYVTDHIDLGH